MSRENLGENPSLVAGASLLVDYILTVAVSVSAGVAAIISIPEFKDLVDYRVALGVGIIVFITLANLRGIKESGRLFAAPTYLYIVMITALVGYGLYRTFVANDLSAVPFDKGAFDGTVVSGGTLGIFLVLKGFSSGAVALTGVEAISNGVPAFRRPESKNAANTLAWMAIILGTLFIGVSVLARHLEPYPSSKQTVLAQMGIQVFGNGAIFFVLQIATALILTLAANTAYADFPRLSSIIARDGYLPRQLANRGDRLVFSNGVVVLAGGRAPARRVRRQDQRVDSALRGRCVRVVHAVPDRHGSPPHEAPRRALAPTHCDQHRSVRSRPGSSRSSSASRSSRAARGCRSSSSR